MGNNMKREERTVLEKRIDEEIRLEALQDEKEKLFARIKRCEKNIYDLKKKENEETSDKITEIMEREKEPTMIANAIAKLQEDIAAKEAEANELKNKKKAEKKAREEEKKAREEEKKAKKEKKKDKVKEESAKGENEEKKDNTAEQEEHSQEHSQANTAESEEKKKGRFGGFRK